MDKKHVFTAIEKKTFLEILKKYSKIIENKDIDGTTLKAKNEAWSKITTEFNASPHVTYQALHKQLRRLWMNLKQRQRGALAKEIPSSSHSLELAAQRYKNTILEREYKDRQRRAEQFHELEIILLKEKIKEAEAKSKLAELILQQQQQQVQSKPNILEREYQDRQRRAEQIHELEIILLKEKIKEAQAKSKLAELI